MFILAKPYYITNINIANIFTIFSNLLIKIVAIYILVVDKF